MLLGGMVVCIDCMAQQTIENAHEPFQNSPNCDRNTDCLFPWEDLGELVGVLLDE